MGSSGIVVFLVSLLIGLYFINLSFTFYVLPESELLGKWMNVLAGVLIILGGINYWRVENHKNQMYQR